MEGIEESLQFFDSVFNAIPPSFRQIDPQEAKQPQKKVANKSLFDIHQEAHTKIKDMQKLNREKSLLKIKELTEQHKLKKTQEESKGAVTNDPMEVESDEEDGAAAGEEKKHANKNT